MLKRKEESSFTKFLNSCESFNDRLSMSFLSAKTQGQSTFHIFVLLLISVLFLSEFSAYWNPQLESDLYVDIKNQSE